MLVQRVDDTSVVVHHEVKRRRDGLPNDEQVRVSRSEHRGVPNLHFRVWYRAATGEYHPTKRGITIPLFAAPHAIAVIAALVPDAVETWLAGEVEGDERVCQNRRTV